MAKLKEKELLHKFLVVIATDPRSTDTADLEKALEAVEGVSMVEYRGSTLRAK